MISQAVGDYLKVIYKLQKQHGKVSTSAIAEKIGVSDASVTSMIKKLAKMNLLKHSSYQGVELTEAGEKYALEIIRHHRLLESYLKEALGFSWDKVDAEAEKLEHVISEEFEDKMDELLGYPRLDPHGDPIPTRDGVVHEEDYERLCDVEEGRSVTIRRVSDSNPEVLKYLGDLGLFPNVKITILKREPFNGPLTLKVGIEQRTIGNQLAGNIFVSSILAKRATKN